MHVCLPHCKPRSHACVALNVQTRHKESRRTTAIRLTLLTCPHHALTMPSPRPHNSLHHAFTVSLSTPHCVLTCRPHVPSHHPQCALTTAPSQCPYSGPTMLQISTCNDLTSSSCELTADGVGAVQSLTQLSDTSYQTVVQVCVLALCPFISGRSPVMGFSSLPIPCLRFYCRYVCCLALVIQTSDKIGPPKTPHL